MTRKTSSRRAVLWAAMSTILFLGGTSSAVAQLRISSNPHYFKNGSTVIPLVGYSAEYLPHIVRPPKKNDYVALDSPYTAYIDEIKARGLNLMQIWVDLNHSIGRAVDNNTTNCDGTMSITGSVPYCSEQPFFWNGSRWRLDRYDTGFFTNLKNVISYAATKGVFVEVTLFDPWNAVDFSSNPTGSSPTSPWSVGNNLWYDTSGVKHIDAHFQETRFLVSFDNGATDTIPTDTNARPLQVKLVQEVVSELNPYTNFYWEIANEPDFNPNRENPAMDICAMIRWHNYIAQTIAQAESTPGLNKHEIGVNFTTQDALNAVQSGMCGTPPMPLALDPNIKIVNNHYVDVRPTPTGSITRYGAITAGRTYNGTGTPINKLFGFNETWESPTASDRMSARAGAWEHMLSEGGSYDHYSLSWNNPDERSKPCSDPTIAGVPTQVRCDLGKLNGFLATTSLQGMVRQTGSKPSWITSGVVDYGAPDWPGSNTYWAAMQVIGSQYAFYYHHSTMSGGRSTRYVPAPGSYQRNFTFNLAGAATGYYYKLEWFYYSPDNPNVQAVLIDSLMWNGTAVTKQTPRYNYDLALRLTRCPVQGLAC
jgi:hypothetical protein